MADLRFTFKGGDFLTEEEEELEILKYGKLLPGLSLRREYILDNDLGNYPLSEGDIINIRSLIDYEPHGFPASFFFTFLIELDPL